MKKAREYWMAAMVVVLTLGALEVALRVLTWAWDDLDRAIVVNRVTIPVSVSDSVLEYRPNPAYEDHDEDGYRNRAVLDQVDVLCMGDSQTYGTWVATEDAWPHVLSDSAGCQTYSMAFGGYGPTHSLMLFDEGMVKQPRVIIEALYFGNDFFESFRHVYISDQLPEFRSQDLSVIDSIEALEARETIREKVSKEFHRGVVAKRSKASSSRSLRPYHHVKTYLLYRAAKKRIQGLFERPPGRDELWGRVVQDASRYRDYEEVFDDGSMRTVFTARYRNMALDASDVRIREGARISMAAVVRMEAESAARGIRFAVLLVPTKEHVFAELARRQGHTLSDSYEQLIKNETYWFGVCERELRLRGVEIVDATEPLRRCLDEGRQPYFENRDGHINEVGHRAVARFVMDSLRPCQ